MAFQRSIRTVVAVALFGLASFVLAANAGADEPTRGVDANVNDAGISTARGQNLVWLPGPARPVGKLLVFLPSGGASNLPTEFKWVGTEGARLGYHTIVLAYRNEVGINAAPPLGCGNNVEASGAPPNCAIDARMELLDGRGESSVVDVNRANSIENRLSKVLEHLVATYPEEGWSRFLDTSGAEPAPKWSETAIAGQSLGSGQAFLIGQLQSVHRVAAFAGWTDAKHGWVTLGATSADRYFTLIHQRDNFFARTCYAYLALSLAPSCPLPGFTIPPATPDPTNPLLVDNREPPFGTPQLVFNLEPAPNPVVIADPFHSSSSRDGWIAKEAGGTTPSQKLLNAWRSILGDSDADTRLDQADNCPLVANVDQTNPDAEQTDTDDDRIGDACDPTPRGTTSPTIIVPAPITVDATGPTGAIVTYTVTAHDDLDGDRTVTCMPPAGSVFPIGGSSVACTATDAGDNMASASFTVTVLGAKEQLVQLIREVIDSTRLPAAVKAQLIASLHSLVAGFDPNDPLQRKSACLKLKVFATVVRFVAPPAVAAEWIADANRIRAVLGC
jgi:hypothetical protein